MRLLDARRQQLAESIAVDESRLRRLDALRKSATGATSVGVPAVRLTTTPSIEVHTRRARVPQLGDPVQALFETAEAVVAQERCESQARYVRSIIASAPIKSAIVVFAANPPPIP